MPNQYTPITVRPTDGGDLITNINSYNVGPQNYTTKRDFRRFMDREIRREGDELFAPVNLAGSESGSLLGSGSDVVFDIGLQPYPNYPDTDEPITLVHLARRPNGKTAIIVGTPTTLYRFFALEEGGVYEEGVYETGVYAEVEGAWIVIGEGFSTEGHRWEAVNLNGYTIFNNGVDLPVSYRVEDFYTKPVYELRESGVAAVGTIGEYNGFFFAADITEIDPEVLPDLLDNIDPPSGFTIEQSGTTVIATGGAGTVFTEDMIGFRIFTGSGLQRTIESVLSSTIVTVTSTGSYSGETFTIENPDAYAVYPEGETTSRIQYRLLWSDVGDPTSWSPSVPVSGNQGEITVSLAYPIRSLTTQDEVVIFGAGESGGNLTAGISFISKDGKTVTLDTALQSSVTDATMFKSSALGSFTGFFDLQDDSSGILRLYVLQNRLVVFKDTSTFVGTYTGSIDLPFEFTKTYEGSDVPFYRWTVANVDGRYLVYAGRNGFHQFDLTQQIPVEHDKLRLCETVFFENVSPEIIEEVYAAENRITNEIWFCFPSIQSDYGIAYSYEFNTCSTIGQFYSAAATVKKPVVGVQTGPSQDWFVMGLDNGIVVLYGKTNVDVPIFTRRDATYDSILIGGLISFGDEFNEKDLRSYVLGLSSQSPNTETMIGLKTVNNGISTPVTRALRTLDSPAVKGLISTYFRAIYFQDQIIVSEQNTDLQIAFRLFEPAQIEDKSVTRSEGTE